MGIENNKEKESICSAIQQIYRTHIPYVRVCICGYYQMSCVYDDSQHAGAFFLFYLRFSKKEETAKIIIFSKKLK